MGFVGYCQVACVYHADGDMDRYFEYMNRAADEHTIFANFVCTRHSRLPRISQENPVPIETQPKRL